MEKHQNLTTRCIAHHAKGEDANGRDDGANDRKGHAHEEHAADVAQLHKGRQAVGMRQIGGWSGLDISARGVGWLGFVRHSDWAVWKCPAGGWDVSDRRLGRLGCVGTQKAFQGSSHVQSSCRRGRLLVPGDWQQHQLAVISSHHVIMTLK